MWKEDSRNAWLAFQSEARDEEGGLGFWDLGLGVRVGVRWIEMKKRVSRRRWFLLGLSSIDAGKRLEGFERKRQGGPLKASGPNRPKTVSVVKTVKSLTRSQHMV